MPAIHIRDVPEDVLAALKRRAIRHDRTLQKELRNILGSIAAEEKPPGPLPPVKLETSSVAGDTTWPREELYGDDGR